MIHTRLRQIDADVVLFQELEKAELDAILAGPLQGYDHHFDVTAEVAHTTSIASAPWGVAVAWRKGLLSNVQKIDLGITGVCGPHPVATIRGTVNKWGSDAIFASAHLDGEAAPPSVSRSEKQVRDIGKKLRELISEKSAAIIWGGDFNQPPNSNALKSVPDRFGFKMLAGASDTPSLYHPLIMARLDHFVGTNVKTVNTHIPPKPSSWLCCNAQMPCYYSILWCGDRVGGTRPVAYPLCSRLVAMFLSFITCIFWLGLIIADMCVPLCFGCVHRRRARWALEQWGSDHMPVVCEFESTRKNRQSAYIVSDEPRIRSEAIVHLSNI